MVKSISLTPMPKLSNTHLKICWSYSDLAAGLMVCVLASLPFLQVAGFSFLNYDDPLHISAQPAVLSGLNAQSVGWSATATPSNLWHPLTWMSYMAEVEWFGGGAESPGVHHVGNLILHLGATFFFFLLLRTLRISTLIAAVVALLFSLHPLHVEPVAWISSRKDVLYAFFAMASLGCYSLSRQQSSRRWSWFLLTLLSLAAALASKPSAIVLPALFVLLDYLPPKDGEVSLSVGMQLRRQLAEKWIYFLLAGLAALMAVLSQYSGSHSEFIGEQGIVGRLSYLPATVAFYLQHSLFPRHLTFEYAFPEGLRYGVLSLVGCACLLAMAYLWWCKCARVFLIGGLWFLICLAPVLGVFYVGSGFTADRYAYLALAGPAIALALFLQSLPARQQGGGLGVLALVVGVFGLLSYQQVRVWKDDAALFSHAVITEPRSGTAQTNLATLYRMQGKDDLALVHYQKALKLNASYYIVYYNIAQIELGKGEKLRAIEACHRSLKSNPNYARTHHLLARLLLQSGGHSDEAMDHFEQACQLDPASVRFAKSCARAHARRRQYAQADHVLQQVLKHGAPSPREQAEIETMRKKLGGVTESSHE